MSAPTFAQIKKTFLKQPMTTSDTSLLVNSLVDIYGNAMAIGTLGNPFYFTISPGGTDEEICSATGITQNADGTCTISGLTRGLSAVTPYAAGGTPQNHGASTPIVFLPDNPQLLNNIISYVNGLVLAAAVQATDATVGYANTSIAPVASAFSRVQSVLVSQQGTPATTVYVQPFAITGLNTNVQWIGGNSPALANPATNPRVDLVVYNGGSIFIRQGTENVLATTSNWATYAPTPTTADIVLAAIFNRHVSGSVQVKDRDDSTNAFIVRWYEPGVYTSLTLISTNSLLTDVDQSQTTQNSTQAVGKAAGAGNAVLVAQSFVPAVNNIRGVSLYKSADTGTFTGTLTVSLQADSAGLPSGSNLAAGTAITNAEWLNIPTGEFTVQFSIPYSSLVVGAKYWIVVTTSTTDSSNHPALGLNTAGGYANGSLSYYNGTTWNAVSTSILYFKERGGAISQIVQTDANGALPLIIKSYAYIAGDATATIMNTIDSVERTLFKSTIAQDLWRLNSGFKIKLDWGFAGSSGNGSAIGYTLNIKYAGQTLLSFSGSSGTGAANINLRDLIEIYVINQASLSSQAYFYVGLQTTGTSNSQPTTTTSPINGNGTSSIDTSIFGAFEVTAKLVPNSSSVPAATLYYNSSVIEKIG